MTGLAGQGRSLWQAVLLTVLLGGLQACSSLPHIVILHDPLTPQEHATLGEAYQARGDTEGAAREFEEALRRQSEFVPAFIGLGNLAFARGALDDAERWYRRALEAAPEDAGASNNLAMVYVARNQRLDEAERLTRSALEHGGPLRPYALDTLARIYVRQGRYMESKAALEMAEALAPPDNVHFREGLSRSRRELAAVYPSDE
jgi:tetratricopeptide (TPR) repeat protein